MGSGRLQCGCPSTCTAGTVRRRSSRARSQKRRRPGLHGTLEKVSPCSLGESEYLKVLGWETFLNVDAGRMRDGIFWARKQHVRPFPQLPPTSVAVSTFASRFYTVCSGPYPRYLGPIFPIRRLLGESTDLVVSCPQHQKCAICKCSLILVTTNHTSPQVITFKTISIILKRETDDRFASPQHRFAFCRRRKGSK